MSQPNTLSPPCLACYAGDATHGARLLYDIGDTGEPEYALALVQTIYRLGDEVRRRRRQLLGTLSRWASSFCCLLAALCCRHTG